MASQVPLTVKASCADLREVQGWLLDDVSCPSCTGTPPCAVCHAAAMTCNPSCLRSTGTNPDGGDPVNRATLANPPSLWSMQGLSCQTSTRTGTRGSAVGTNATEAAVTITANIPGSGHLQWLRCRVSSDTGPEGWATGAVAEGAKLQACRRRMHSSALSTAALKQGSTASTAPALTASSGSLAH